MSNHQSTFKEYIKCKKLCETLRNRLKTQSLERAKKDPRLLQESTTKVGPKDGGNQIDFRCRKFLRGHFGKIYAIDCSNSDIISTGQDEKIIVWNCNTGLKSDVISKTTPQMAISFSSDGKRIATGGLDNLCAIYFVHDTTKGQGELSKHHGYISTCQFINNSELVTSSGDGTCIVWDLKKEEAKCEFTDHSGDVLSLDSKPESKHVKNPNVVISCSTDESVKVWDIRMTPLSSNNNNNNKNNNNKSNIYLEEEEEVKINISSKNKSEYKAGSSGCVMTLYGHDGDVNSVRWFPSYEYTFASGGDDGTIRLWDIRAVRQMNEYKAGKSGGNRQNDNMMSSIQPSVASVEFSNSGFLIFGGFDESPYCQAFDTLSCSHYSVLLHESRVSAVKMIGDGNGIATGSWDTVLRIWA